MSLAGWVVLGDENAVERQMESRAEAALPGQCRGAFRQRHPPGETSIRDERISAFWRLVNKLRNPRLAGFSIREFVFVCLLGSRTAVTFQSDR